MSVQGARTILTKSKLIFRRHLVSVILSLLKMRQCKLTSPNPNKANLPMSDKCAKIIVGLVINEQTGAKSLDEVKLDLDNLI